MESVFPSKRVLFFFLLLNFPHSKANHVSFSSNTFLINDTYDDNPHVSYLPIAFSFSKAPAKDKVVLKTYKSFVVFFPSPFLYLAPVSFIPVYLSPFTSQYLFPSLVLSCVKYPTFPRPFLPQGISGEAGTVSSKRKTEALL